MRRLSLIVISVLSLVLAVPFAATPQTQPSGTITSVWTNPPTGTATSPGTKVQYATALTGPWTDGCTGTGAAATTCKFIVPLGAVYYVQAIRLSVDPQFNSDPTTPPSKVTAIKEPGPGGFSATININP